MVLVDVLETSLLAHQDLVDYIFVYFLDLGVLVAEDQTVHQLITWKFSCTLRHDSWSLEGVVPQVVHKLPLLMCQMVAYQKPDLPEGLHNLDDIKLLWHLDLGVVLSFVLPGRHTAVLCVLTATTARKNHTETFEGVEEVHFEVVVDVALIAKGKNSLGAHDFHELLHPWSLLFELLFLMFFFVVLFFVLKA